MPKKKPQKKVAPGGRLALFYCSYYIINQCISISLSISLSVKSVDAPSPNTAKGIWKEYAFP